MSRRKRWMPPGGRQSSHPNSHGAPIAIPQASLMLALPESRLLEWIRQGRIRTYTTADGTVRITRGSFDALQHQPIWPDCR
jgi:hypothetical protein